MELTLALPGLLDGAQDAAHAPDLAALLASAVVEREGAGLLAVLAPSYGVTRQRDWPLAALRAAAYGLDPDDAYWLRAVPVTLVAGRDDVRVAGAVEDLESQAAAALVEVLNAHFRNDGLRFVAPSPQEWLLRLAAPPALATHPLRTVVGRALRPLLPQGDDAPQWRRWAQEIEMLLHDHDVNRMREARGLPPVNALWFDEGGTRAPPTTRPIATWSADRGAVALARHGGAVVAPVPESLGPVLASRSAVAVVMLDEAGDLAQVETRFAAPARAASNAGALARLTIVGDGLGSPAAVFRVTRPGAWQRLFGRRRVPSLAATLAGLRETVGR